MRRHKKTDKPSDTVEVARATKPCSILLGHNEQIIYSLTETGNVWVAVTGCHWNFKYKGITVEAFKEWFEGKEFAVKTHRKKVNYNKAAKGRKAVGG